MNSYEKLIVKYQNEVKIQEVTLEYGFLGLYKNGMILIDKKLNAKKKHSVLSEEIGHHKKSVGCLIVQNTSEKRKQELLGRRWGYEEVLSFKNLVRARENGCLTKYEVMDYLDITEDFFDDALKYYRSKYGLSVTYDNYIIHLDPLNIIKKGEIKCVESMV